MELIINTLQKNHRNFEGSPKLIKCTHIEQLINQTVWYESSSPVFFLLSIVNTIKFDG